jgi:hypothetical protein
MFLGNTAKRRLTKARVSLNRKAERFIQAYGGRAGALPSSSGIASTACREPR